VQFSCNEITRLLDAPSYGARNIVYILSVELTEGGQKIIQALQNQILAQRDEENNISDMSSAIGWGTYLFL